MLEGVVGGDLLGLPLLDLAGRVFGRQAGSVEGYNYSPALREADFTWTAQQLDQWLNDPRGFLPGNKMAFAGIRDETDRRDLIAWLKLETGYTAE